MSARTPPLPRIGVVGLGRFGRAHVHTLIGLGCPPVAVADPDPRARSRVREELPTIRAFTDVHEMVGELALDGMLALDGVIVATPSPTHVDVAISAAEQVGLVLIEKPVASTADGIARLRSAGLDDRMMPGHVLRFDPAHRALKDVVDSGRIGAVRMISATRDRDVDHQRWYDDPDPIFLTQVHDLDLALWLSDETAVSVSSVGPLVAGRRPAVSTQATTASGIVWSLRAGYLLAAGSTGQDRLEVVGDRGTALLTVGSTGIRLSIGPAEEIIGSWPPVDAPGLVGELTSFLARLRGDPATSGAASLEEAGQVIDVALAARSSIGNGGAVVRVTASRPTSPATLDARARTAREATQHGPLIPPEEWHRLTGTYLYTGAQSPALSAVGRAVLGAVEAQSDGAAGRAALAECELEGQRVVAGWARCDPADVAFVGDASTAWNMIAGGLAWEPGDNVVVNTLEHPSVSFPFLRLAASGLSNRVVESSTEWMIDPDDIEAAIDAHTRAVVLSHVSYVNGARHDVDAVSRIADAAGVPLFIDWSHSLGVLPIDSRLCAIGVSASYKWALGPYGVGVVIWNRNRLADFRPGLVGWRSTPDFFHDDRFTAIRLGESADRFRLGAASYSGIAGLTAGLQRLGQLGQDRIAEHALTLSGAAHTALTSLGFEVITPQQVERRGGSVAIRHDRGTELADRIALDGVKVWAGDGRLRASFHAMNGLADVTTFVDALDRARRDLP